MDSKILIAAIMFNKSIPIIIIYNCYVETKWLIESTMKVLATVYHEYCEYPVKLKELYQKLHCKKLM